jgi:hypothetical protein
MILLWLWGVIIKGHNWQLMSLLVLLLVHHHSSLLKWSTKQATALGEWRESNPRRPSQRTGFAFQLSQGGASDFLLAFTLNWCTTPTKQTDSRYSKPWILYAHIMEIYRPWWPTLSARYRGGRRGGVSPPLVCTSCAPGAPLLAHSYHPSWDQQEPSNEATSPVSLCDNVCQRYVSARAQTGLSLIYTYQIKVV